MANAILVNSKLVDPGLSTPVQSMQPRGGQEEKKMIPKHKQKMISRDQMQKQDMA